MPRWPTHRDIQRTASIAASSTIVAACGHSGVTIGVTAAVAINVAATVTSTVATTITAAIAVSATFALALTLAIVAAASRIGRSLSGAWWPDQLARPERLLLPGG